nr:MAG TPA: Cytosine specific methyltransferase [Caudoviricetes sp.]
MKLLIGGSPCTHWSIAQTKNRETTAEGIGWELFLNYRIARDKYKPDYFLYENNKSMSPAIRAQITAELGVEPVLINSALVSAQNRQRLYWVGKRDPDGTYSQVPVEQPEDRGILLRDILETGVAWQEKAYTLKAQYYKNWIANFVTNGGFSATAVAEPVRIGTIENDAKNQDHDSQQYRVYSPDGKSVTLCGNGGGLGAKTGLYATPAGGLDGKAWPVYEVRDGFIAIKGKRYPIKLRDGHYVIRKLTVRECMRLQTVPEEYVFPVSDSQAYKMLGNGWTVDVIAHIMSHFDGLTAEPVEVLSMYDGMSCGHIALDKLGAEIASYHATEIDRFAIQTTQANFPDVVQLGDAFQVRERAWTIWNRQSRKGGIP